MRAVFKQVLVSTGRKVLLSTGKNKNLVHAVYVGAKFSAQPHLKSTALF
jgi:hypothetical protein